MDRFGQMQREQVIAVVGLAPLSHRASARVVGGEALGHFFDFSVMFATSADDASRSSGNVSLLNRTSTDPLRFALALISSELLFSRCDCDVETDVFTFDVVRSGSENQPPPCFVFSS